MSDSTIHIALPSDQNYLPGLIVTIYSMAEHAREEADLAFHILDGGIHDDSFSLMESAVKSIHPRCSFVRHKIAEQDFSAFPSFHGNRMTYVRYLLPSLLPDEDFVIYADSDCLWLADVADLWSLRDEKVILKATLDDYGVKTEKPWFTSHGIPWHEGKYFCNGLLLMNLDLFRKQSIVEKASQFVLSHPDIQYADQSSFNAVIGEDVKIISSDWNVFTRSLMCKIKGKGIVLHYANRLPWRDTLWTDFLPSSKRLWHDCYCKATHTQRSKSHRICNFMDVVLLGQILIAFLPRRFFRWPLFWVLQNLKMDNYIASLSFVIGSRGKVKFSA